MFDVGSYWKRSEACTGEREKGAVRRVEVEDDDFPFWWGRSHIR